MAKIRDEIHEVNNTISSNIAVTNVLEERLANKISIENFTKLINDSQDVINQLDNKVC